MSYFVFDLDETLAHLSSVYYHIVTLKMRNYVVNQREYMDLYYPKDLHDELEKAYDLFVNAVLKQEQSSEPLGILRPGILGVMEGLADLKRKNKVNGVIIYSNNGYLENLEFVKDLIHRHVGMELIKECVHRFHPMREGDNQGEIPLKTWGTLKRILVEGSCRASRFIEPKHVYFFDDLHHTDLEMKLGETYYCVSPFSFRASVDRINEIYEACLKQTNANIGLLLLHMVDIVELGDAIVMLNPLQGTMSDLLGIFHKATQGTYHAEVPQGFDVGVLMMNDAIGEAAKRKRKRRWTMKHRRYTVKK